MDVMEEGMSWAAQDLASQLFHTARQTSPTQHSLVEVDESVVVPVDP